MQNIKIRGREFTVEGPTPRYGTYLLTGTRGATYLAMPFQNDPSMLFVVGGRSLHSLYIQGNQVILTTKSGELREARS